MNRSPEFVLRPRRSLSIACLALVVSTTACDGGGESGSRGVEPSRADVGSERADEDAGTTATADAEQERPASGDGGVDSARETSDDGSVAADGNADAGSGSEPSEGDAAPSDPVAPRVDAGKAPPPPPRPEKGDAGAPREPVPSKRPEAGPAEPTPEEAENPPVSDAGAHGGNEEQETGASPSGPSAKVRELTTLVKQAYSEARGFEAEFNQTYRNRLLGRNQDSTGHVWLRPPTRMRWEYRTPTKNLIVADGRNLFVFEPEPNQVIRMPVGDSELPSVMAFLTGGRDLNEDYHCKLVSESVTKALAKRGQAGLELRPRRPSSVVERVVLVIGREDGRVQKTVLVEPEGNTNTFVWSKVRTDSEISDTRFTFTPPANARVMERGR